MDSLALTNVQLNLLQAYNNFFADKKKGFPKYKSKHKSKMSYTTNLVNNNIKVNQENSTITLPKVGTIKCCFHRAIPSDYNLKSVTVSKEPSGEYYVSILYEYEYTSTHKCDEAKTIGLDFSMKSGYVDSNGEICNYPHYFRIMENKLAKEQRKLAKKKEIAKKNDIKLDEAKNYQKQKRIVARIHQKIKNQRKDFLHKKSRELVNDYDVICIEDLDMKGMSQALNFGKSVSDNGKGMFTTFLTYKATLENKKVVKIGRFEPSSKLCNVCGYENQNLTLAIRTWQCPCCNTMHDRDINAAINIKKIGLSMLSA